MGEFGFGIPNLKPGTRVQLHPASDLWMRGATTGTIKRIDANGNYKIRIDHPRIENLRTFHPEDVRPTNWKELIK